jgi:hypothetical protein
MQELVDYVVRHRKVILITFELFWIVVFLLSAATRGGGAEVAQFVYVNF